MPVPSTRGAKLLPISIEIFPNPMNMPKLVALVFEVHKLNYRGQPFHHSRLCIKGLLKMKKGSTRCLVIPHQLAYGHRAMGDVIPAYSTLIFEVQLIDIFKSKK